MKIFISAVLFATTVTAMTPIFPSLAVGAGGVLRTVTVGYSPVVSSAGIFIAQERGYFREYGLNVQLTPFRSSGAPMTALLSKGELDVGGGNITAGLWNAKNHGIEIRLVADKGHVEPGHSYLALLVAADHLKTGRYKSFKDLKGFKMALTSAGGVSQEIAAEKFLKAGGLGLSDVSFLKMSYAEMNLALKNKMLDATVQLEPYVTQAVLAGFAGNVAGLSEVYPEQPSAAIFYSSKFSKTRRPDAVGFMAAYLRGVRDYIAAFSEGKDRNRVVEILKKYTDVQSDEVWGKMIPVGLNPNGYINKTALMNDLAWYQSKGYIRKAPAMAEVVDDSFADDALKLIGKAKAKNAH